MQNLEDLETPFQNAILVGANSFDAPGRIEGIEAISYLGIRPANDPVVYELLHEDGVVEFDKPTTINVLVTVDHDRRRRFPQEIHTIRLAANSRLIGPILWTEGPPGVSTDDLAHSPKNIALGTAWTLFIAGTTAVFAGLLTDWNPVLMATLAGGAAAGTGWNLHFKRVLQEYRIKRSGKLRVNAPKIPSPANHRTIPL